MSASLKTLDPDTEMLVHQKGRKEIDPMSGVDPFGADSIKLFDPWSIELAKHFFGNSPTDLGYAQSIKVVPPTQSLYVPLRFKIHVPGSVFDRYFVRIPERKDWYKQLVDNVRKVNGFTEDVEILTHEGVPLREIPLEVAYRTQDDLGLFVKKLAAVPEPYEHSDKAFESHENHHDSDDDNITSSGHRLIDNVLKRANDHSIVNKIPLTKVLGSPEVLQKFIFSALEDPSIQKILVEANLTTGTLSVLVGKIGEAIVRTTMETQLEHGDDLQSVGCPYCTANKAPPQENYYYGGSRPMGCPYCSQSARRTQQGSEDQRIGRKYNSKYDSSSDSDEEDDYSVDSSSSDEEDTNGNSVMMLKPPQLTDDRTLTIVGGRLKSGIYGFLNSFAQNCNSAKSTLKFSKVNFNGLGSVSSIFSKSEHSRVGSDSDDDSSEDEGAFYPREYRPRVSKKVELSIENMFDKNKSRKHRKPSRDSDDDDDDDDGDGEEEYQSGRNLFFAGNSRVKTNLNPDNIRIDWIKELGPGDSCSNFVGLLEKHSDAVKILKSLSDRREHLILFVMSNRKMSPVLATNMITGCNRDTMEDFIKRYTINTSKNPEHILEDGLPYSLTSIGGSEFKITSTIGGKLLLTPKHARSKILGFGTTWKGKKKIYIAVF